MQHGICHLSAIPVRETADRTSSMVNQLLYGDVFKIKEERKFWSRIQTLHDNFEGWVLNIQIQQLSEDSFQKINDTAQVSFNADLVAFLSDTCSGGLISIPFGAETTHCSFFEHTFEGHDSILKKDKNELVHNALLYLNSPYLEGGRTPFGIDNSGLTQMVYRLNGFSLKRIVAEQATQGTALSFIEESEPGDLAFFDNKEGEIDHVGIILKDNYIVHAHGKVRIDRIDHTGIFNAEEKRYSHQLRVIKKMV